MAEKMISPEAQNMLQGLDKQTQDYILSKDFGKQLSDKEVSRFKTQWISSNKAKTGSSSASGGLNGILPESMQNLAIYNMPKEAFDTLVSHMTPGTPEYQAAMDKLNTGFYDVLQQQLNASTEQEQIAAEHNWKTLKSTLESSLGISLSNDAFQAWDQMQSAKNQTAQGNMAGTGIAQEDIDSYLNKVRRSDQQARTQASSQSSSNEENYYKQFATPAQIKALVASDPEKARSLGLLPSAEILATMNPAAMKAKYPNMSDQDIQEKIATILDENGNYRSNLYQKYMTGNSVGVNPGNVNKTLDQYGTPIAETVTPSDTGMLDINAAKNLWKSDTVENSSQAAAAAAARNLGSTQPTAGSNGGVDTTLFNKINATALPSSSANKNTSLENPINIPGSMTTSGSTGGSSSKSNDRGGLSKREFAAKQSGGTLNYKTGNVK